MKLSGVTGSVLLLALLQAGVVQARNPVIPDKLAAPASERLALEARASGVQIYVCAARKDDAARAEWTLKAPEAELFGVDGKRIGKHYGGPTWEAADGSKVVGELKARDDGPDSNAIPWLLLAAKSNNGAGVFGKTSSIQRLYTNAGKAPATGCDAASVGKELRVPYTATYLFYQP